MTMISATHINSAATFSWTLLHLLRNPAHLTTHLDEISTHPASVDGVYPWREMPFAGSCLRETGRLYTNLLMFRFLPRDVLAPDGTLFPKGWVAVSPITTQRDPSLFDNPDRWDPTRFLDGSCPFHLRSAEFIQFGLPPHACLGEKFTYSLLRGVLWPTLLDGYEVELVEGVEEGEGVDGVGVAPNWKESMGTAVGMREVFVSVTRRKETLSGQECRQV